MTRAQRRREIKAKRKGTFVETSEPIQEFKPEKGIELCNRTACQTDQDVCWFNSSTRKWYCPKCANLINRSIDGFSFNNICQLDTDKQYYEEIKNQLNIGYYEYKKQKDKMFSF